jgi:hypothetical protein
MSERVMWMSIALVLLATAASIQLINVALGGRGVTADLATANHAADQPPDLPPIKIGLPF